MSSSEKREILEYYNARAPEYDEVYSGGIPASIPDPEAYKEEVEIISKLLPGHISGKCVDMACGTGYWLPFYERNCSEITLIDQSESMLAECVRKIQKLGIESKTEIIRDDLFAYPFQHNKYDSVFIGFLLTHLPESAERNLFRILKRILKPGGKFVITDSVWSEERDATRDKAGLQKRALEDGREFTIYKRYFEEQDIKNLARKYKTDVNIIHWGRVCFYAVGNIPGALN